MSVSDRLVNEGLALTFVSDLVDHRLFHNCCRGQQQEDGQLREPHNVQEAEGGEGEREFRREVTVNLDPGLDLFIIKTIQLT